MPHRNLVRQIRSSVALETFVNITIYGHTVNAAISVQSSIITATSATASLVLPAKPQYLSGGHCIHTVIELLQSTELHSYQTFVEILHFSRGPENAWNFASNSGSPLSSYLTSNLSFHTGWSTPCRTCPVVMLVSGSLQIEDRRIGVACTGVLNSLLFVGLLLELC